jgi:hypothetical protein
VDVPEVGEREARPELFNGNAQLLRVDDGAVPGRWLLRLVTYSSTWPFIAFVLVMVIVSATASRIGTRSSSRGCGDPVRHGRLTCGEVGLEKKKNKIIFFYLLI